jgi:putative glycosyltransferase
MKFSIVTTTYNSTSTIVPFVQRIHQTAKSLGNDFEIVIVDDGSTDDSVFQSRNLIKSFKEIVLVELSRNFGHHEALLCGLEKSKGDFVFLIDSDLEESPELLKTFYNELSDSNFDVVFGVSDRENIGLISRSSSSLFWKLFGTLTKLQIPVGVCTVRLMNRRYVDALLLHKEINVFLAGLWAVTGFKQKSFKIKKVYKGSSSYTFRKKIDLAFTSLVSFSGRPLRLIALVGMCLVVIALLMLSILIIRYFIWGDSSEGWLSIVSLLVLFGGLQIAAIGLVAIYVASILDEVKSRPRTIVTKVWKEE